MSQLTYWMALPAMIVLVVCGWFAACGFVPSWLSTVVYLCGIILGIYAIFDIVSRIWKDIDDNFNNNEIA